MTRQKYDELLRLWFETTAFCSVHTHALRVDKERHNVYQQFLESNNCILLYILDDMGAGIFNWIFFPLLYDKFNIGIEFPTLMRGKANEMMPFALDFIKENYDVNKIVSENMKKEDIVKTTGYSYADAEVELDKDRKSDKSAMQRYLGYWGREIWGEDHKARIKGNLEHLRLEVEELIEAVENKNWSEALKEIADVNNLAYDIADRIEEEYGVPMNVDRAMIDKLEECKTRTWLPPDENGVVRHLKDKHEQILSSVVILDTVSGEKRTVEGINAYAWEEGNWSCDCNRSIYFEDDDEHFKKFDGVCRGEKRFLVVDFKPKYASSLGVSVFIVILIVI